MKSKHLRVFILSMVAILCGGSMYAQTVKEKAIIDTDFQDWTKGSTATIVTNFSNETITFSMENATVDPNATNDGKFNSALDPAYRGYIMCEKKASTVTTTTFKNITRIRYRHGATGSNRGWGLKIKVGEGDWEIINDVKISSPVWVEKEINKENVQLQWYNLNESQNAYMFELEVYANVESSAKQVTLTTAVSPQEAGTVTVKPSATEYDENTELTLTAEKNFGYQFKQWTKDGQVIGSNATLTYTITENSTIVAEFEPITTYELNITVDGSNSYMVAATPSPNVVDGKNMYEEGQTVQLTANQYEGLVTFNNWSDGDTNSEKTITMTENVAVTATYSQADIIAGWDFYLTGNNGRIADFAAQDNEADALSLVNTETGETQGWLDKSYESAGGYETFKGAAVNWQKGSANGDVGHWHWQTKINAEAFTDINVQFQMLYNFNAYQTYNVEYSLNGTDWTNVGSITMEGAKNPASFSGKLPEAANNQKDLYIRMIADKTSSIDGTASANDGNALAMFFITGTAKLIDDGQAPVLVSSVPAEGATGVSASGKIVLTFDERVKLADDAVAYVNNTYIKSITQNPTKGTVNGKTITFEYKGLEYDTPPRFVLPAKAVADLTDNYIAEDIVINFTTMARPTVAKGIYDAVVENVDELLAAFKAADERSDKNVRYRIFLKKGTYQLPQGTTDVTYNVELKDGSTASYTKKDPITRINSGNISLIGESRDEVVITNTIPADETFDGRYGTASVYEGIGKSDVLQTRGENLYYQDLTVSTGMDDARGRDIAIEDMGAKTIYKNVCLHGYQDTWVGQNDRGLYYFEDGVVRGRTDYMCGKGDAFFNRVELRQLKGGYAAHQPLECFLFRKPLVGSIRIASSMVMEMV